MAIAVPLQTNVNISSSPIRLEVSSHYLRTTLRIHVEQVIIALATVELFDLMLERLSTKDRRTRQIGTKTDRVSLMVIDGNDCTEN